MMLIDYYNLTWSVFDAGVPLMGLSNSLNEQSDLSKISLSIKGNKTRSTVIETEHNLNTCMCMHWDTACVLQWTAPSKKDSILRQVKMFLLKGSFILGIVLIAITGTPVSVSAIREVPLLKRCLHLKGIIIEGVILVS